MLHLAWKYHKLMLYLVKMMFKLFYPISGANPCGLVRAEIHLMALKENQRCLADHLGFSAAFAPLQGIPQLPCKVVGAERFLGSQSWGAILGCGDCFLVLGF